MEELSLDKMALGLRTGGKHLFLVEQVLKMEQNIPVPAGRII